MPYLTSLADGAVLLHIYVQPKASKSKIVGIHDGCLKLAVAAPPVDGRANEELARSLARLLGLPGRAVSIHSGDKSRKKKVRVEAAYDDVLGRIERILAGISAS